MANYAEKYKQLSNLQLKKLLRERDRLSPEAVMALLAETKERGLAPPPFRAPATGGAKAKRRSRKLSSWFDLSATWKQPGDPNVLDGGLTRPNHRAAQDLKRAKALFPVWLLYTVIRLVYSGAIYGAVFSNRYASPTDHLWLAALALIPMLPLFLIAYGVYKLRHWGLGGVAFLMGFHGMGVAQSIITEIEIYNLSGESIPWGGALLSVLSSAGLIALVLYVILRKGVHRAFQVGPKFIQSYLFIGISIGILYYAILGFIARTAIPFYF